MLHRPKSQEILNPHLCKCKAHGVFNFQSEIQMPGFCRYLAQICGILQQEALLRQLYFNY